jgi:glutathione S-transferase
MSLDHGWPHAMSPLILYGHEASGHSYKVALALALTGLEYDFRWVDVHAPRSERRADFQAVSRFGEIPVLIHDGRTLAQSNAILLHLMEHYGFLGGETAEGRDESRQWLFWEANRIGFSLSNIRSMLCEEPSYDPAALEWLRKRFEQDVERLEVELSRKAFLLGTSVSVADVSCSAYLFFAKEAGIDPSTWPNISRWLERLMALPGYRPPTDLMRRP